MSNDFLRETTGASWLGRLGAAVKGILIGGVMVLIACGLLFWNEGRAVKRAKSLAEGQREVVSISADRMDSENEGKLVHFTGDARTAEAVKDPVLGISAPVLRLERKVFMYQWMEKTSSSTNKNLGGSTSTTTTYTYSKGWADHLIDSTRFKELGGHANPGTMRLTTETWTGDPITVGMMALSAGFAARIPVTTPLAVSQDALALLPEEFRRSATMVPEVEAAAKNLAEAPNEKGGIYMGSDPKNPQLGDLKVSYRMALPGPISVIGAQHGNRVEAFATSNGGTIELLEAGTHDAAAMFKQAVAANRNLTWLLRGGGFLLFFVGFALIFKPLSVLADVVPLVGSIVGMSTGVLAFFLALGGTTATIAVAWLYYRPLLSVGLFAVMLAAGYGVVRFRKRRPVAPTAALR